MILLKKSTPYIPRLVMVKVEPLISSGDNFWVRAFEMSCLVSTDRERRCLVSASWITGVMSPSSTATLKARWAAPCCLMWSPFQEALTSGTHLMASALALRTRSFIVTLNPPSSGGCSANFLFIAKRASSKGPALISHWR